MQLASVSKLLTCSGRTVGMFDSDEIMKEIIEEGRRIRVEDREKTDS